LPRASGRFIMAVRRLMSQDLADSTYLYPQPSTAKVMTMKALASTMTS
jgi:hypothetical protein